MSILHVLRCPTIGLPLQVSVMILLFVIVLSFLAVCSAGDLALGSLTPSTGFRIKGAANGERSGFSVSTAGDVNGDGVDDIIIGGLICIAYVIFGGKNAGGTGDLQLPASTMAASVGFRILGATANDYNGYSTSSAGDVNGDGVGDIIIGAPGGNPSSAGISYVIFGRKLSAAGANPFGDVQLPSSTMIASLGFRILGAAAGDECGSAVSGAGDVNGDGIDDVILGVYKADPPVGAAAGVSYVIYGKNLSNPLISPFGDIQLPTSAMSIDVGFRIIGAAFDDLSGFSVSRAGDINKDGFSDVLIGAPQGDPSSGTDAGISYVIFGHNSNGDVQLTTGTNVLGVNVGFRILGAATNDRNGWSVSAAGDVNHDGVDDIIIGSYQADLSWLGTDNNAGIAYVIYGRNVPGGATAFSDIQLTSSAITATVGFRILGSDAEDRLGGAVSGAGDMNGDGIDDIIVGARFADVPAKGGAGVSYVIFGRSGAAPFNDIQLPSFGNGLTDSVGYRILGAVTDDNSGWSVSTAGDFNDDGLADVIVGANYADPTFDSNAGISYVVFGVSTQPTWQPTSQPSGQPSRQPTSQPSRQPSSQPTKQPQSLPSGQPSRQPSAQPSSQPSAQPSAQPLTQPTSQPSRQPSAQPSNQPSRQPSGQPSKQPTCAPSTQPSGQPTRQPSAQPTNQPSEQPSGQPSIRPSRLPTEQPSSQPSVRPSKQPWSQPTSQPSCRPSQQPSRQPTIQPSVVPTTQPTLLPTTQPTTQPSVQPSVCPSKLPSVQPSRQPSSEPSSQPICKPTTQPSCQPSGRPSERPTVQPSSQPSHQPSIQPSYVPSAQPSSKPRAQPSAHPTSEPSGQPSIQPFCCPITQPSDTPSNQPTSVPSIQADIAPSSSPSVQPSTQSSSQPSGVPSRQISMKPSTQPSSQPSPQPSSLPTLRPSASPSEISVERVTPISNAVSISYLAYVHGQVYACGPSENRNTGVGCTMVDPVRGTQYAQYQFAWSDITAILSNGEPLSIIISGHTIHAESTATELASCLNNALQLTCSGTTFVRTSFLTGIYVESVNRMVYTGIREEKLFATVVNFATNTFSHYSYSTNNMATVTFTHAHSPPNYVGSFLAGTCSSVTLLNYICAGMMRTDSGSISAMYIAPASGSILNSAELVNAMALEHIKPDSFIAGGIEMSDGAGTNPYIVRVNSLYYSVLYGVRYRMHNTVSNNRRILQEAGSSNSVVKGMAWVDTFLYLIVDYTEPSSFFNSVAILMTHISTGQILKQVQIYANDASIRCSDIVNAEHNLVVSCSSSRGINSSEVFLLSIDRELTLSRLPTGFRKDENITFYSEQIVFYRRMLLLSMEPDERATTNDYTFTATNGGPTLRPSEAPIVQPTSNAPSGQPSSSPTSAPSVSPQPSSQPSSSGPTNTYKPTVKPTQRPSTAPSQAPTIFPTAEPTLTPTTRPTVAPSSPPSIRPTLEKTALPTWLPSAKPSRSLTNLPTLRPTQVPSVAPTAEVSTVQAKAPNNNRAYLIVGYVVAGLAGLWLLYILRRWCQYKLDGVQSDANRTLYVESIADKPKPRYPIFAYIVSLFVVVKAVEVDFIAVENNTTIPVPATTYNGIGANIEGHTELPDLEANLPSQETENTIYTEQKQQRVVVPALLESVRKGDSSDLNSFKSSSEFDVDVVLSEESSYIASEYGRSELENTAEGDSFGGLGELPSSDSESEGTQYSS